MILQATVTVETIVQSVSTFITAAVGWFGEILELIGTEPILLLLVVVLGVSGFAIGGIKRLTRV